jgi:c(7)-type cytochrome triheme protein
LIATVWFMVTAPTEAPPKAAPVAKADAPLRTDIPPPDTIVFENKYGKSTFTHKLHYERVKGECTVCHTKIFPQTQAPLANYGKANHRVAEAEGTACAFCHRVGGTSFAADSHCVKCHESQY